jgi:H+/Cl- antiporter ClcA
VAASFSAPIGGVIFSLELMLPQTYDAFAYWGCFTASVVGTLVETWPLYVGISPENVVFS